MKRHIIWVNHLSRGQWIVEVDKAHTDAEPKRAAIRRAVQIAKDRHAKDGSVYSVKIRDEKGAIRDERTIPRGSDPRRTPG